MLITLDFVCCACALLEVSAENAPRPPSARTTPARAINRPSKTRTLKKADCDVDFFFMEFADDVDAI